MSAPTVVSAKWAKGKCDTYCLSSDGKSFSGFMHCAGRALSYSNFPTDEEDKAIQFMSCRNRGFARWSPCSASSMKVSKVPPGQSFECTFVLLIGVSLNHQTEDIEYNYIVWKGDLCGHLNIKSAMASCKKPLDFVMKYFSQKIIITSTKSIHMRHLNQVSGPTFSQWG